MNTERELPMQAKTEKIARTPWRTNGNAVLVDADGNLVVAVPRPKGTGATARRDFTAKLIVRAVNSHGDLLAACKMAIAFLERESVEQRLATETGCVDGDVERISLRAAIAKAGAA